jgi:CRISPR-associated exonuclease Cas4
MTTTGLLALALVLAGVGVLVLVLARKGRQKRGLGEGKTVSLDDVTLFSEEFGLVGRPDRLVREGEFVIPEEWKSAKRVSDSHRLQLACYMLLVEETYGVRPPHGVVVLCERHLERASPGRPNRASQGGMTDGRSDREALLA